MIDKKLKVLSAFIDSLAQQNPEAILENHMKKITLTKKSNIDDSKDICIEFNRSIQQVIDQFKDKGLDGDIILYNLYLIIQQMLFKHLIYQKALELDINPLLYKKKMGFLFKGKPLD